MELLLILPIFLIKLLIEGGERKRASDQARFIYGE